MPGCAVKYDTFMHSMWKAVARGHVPHDKAVFVQSGLRHGFKAGIDTTKMVGQKIFKNYKSALEGREAVTRATMKRVQAGKTLQLGSWSTALVSSLKAFYAAFAVFPMGAVPKPLEPTELRPTDDHTRTGLNAATDLEGLRHKLDASSEIAWFLQLDYFMRVSDVDGAFTLLPLHPDVWPFFLFKFFADSKSTVETLFCHVMGDFGQAGMPGVFKIFLVDVICGMARSEHVLTLPMTVYVDDCALTGPCAEEVDAEMVAFHAWALEVCGVAFKALKDRLAARRQLYLGFWWDSTTLTRELEQRKLTEYVEMFASYAVRPKLSLREMQSVAGRMQRAIMTFPPGAAWLLVPVFMLMSRLKLPWQQRRTTREARDNFLYCSRMLREALGRGFYSYANFKRAPPVWTDASKSKGYAGGGFVSACGRYDFWRYGSRAARKAIDYLEGDTVVLACARLAHLWRGCIVTIFCDNKAFQQSGAKGRSKAQRLNELVKELFLLMLRYEFIVNLVWICTEDNVNADHLSRDREGDFLEDAYAPEHGCWAADTVPDRMEGAGRTRVLPEKRGTFETPVPDVPVPAPVASKLSAAAATFVPQGAPEDDAASYIARAQAAGGCTYRPAGVGVRRGGTLVLVLALFGCFCVPAAPMPVTQFQASLEYSQTTLFDGLPGDLLAPLESVLDNRLASSSWRKVKSGMKIWRTVASARGYSHIIATGDRQRGAKLVAFVMHMVMETDLVWGSIQTYVWAVRTWMQSQHQADPIMGVRGWGTFMDSVKVLTWVPAEPRRRCPVGVVEKILDATNFNSFKEVQLAFIILCLLYTFSRVECPCPKTFDGRECYDPEVHWRVEDFDVVHVAGRRVLKVRFRVIKQDQRVERPEACGDGDWAYVGDVLGDSKWSPIRWYQRLQQFHGRRADRRGPMFLDPDMRRPLIYAKLLVQFKEAQRAVGVPEDELAGPHGLRVEGYNNTKNRLGQDLAVAQGLWSSSAHKRYDRFDMGRVVRIPSAIVGLDEGDSPDPLNGEEEERPAGPPARRMRRADVRRPPAARESASEAEGDQDPVTDESESESESSGPPVARRRAAPPADGAASSAAAAASGGPSPGAPLHLTPDGRRTASVRPAGYWGEAPRRPARARARSPPGRRSSRSPSSSRD